MFEPPRIMQVLNRLMTLCITLNLSFVYVIGIAPVISYVSQPKVVMVGETVDFVCSVQYAQDYPVVWAKINPKKPSQGVFISSNSLLTTPDNRYSIRHDAASYTYLVQLSKIRESDSGTYQCQVLTSATNRVTADVNLTVLEPPSILDNSTRSRDAFETQRIELECYATGNPQPQISWRRQNNDILPTGSSVYKGNVLIIHNVTKEDRGTYYCIANNGVGKEAKQNVKVRVEFAPQVMPEQEQYAQAVGYPVDLVCNVEGYPKAEILWLRDNYRVTDTIRYQISSLETNEVVTSTLRIKNLTASDFGIYVCHASNKLSTDRKNIRVVRQNFPVCPPACLPYPTQGANGIVPLVFLVFIPALYYLMNL